MFSLKQLSYWKICLLLHICYPPLIFNNSTLKHHSLIYLLHTGKNKMVSLPYSVHTELGWNLAGTWLAQRMTKSAKSLPPAKGFSCFCQFIENKDLRRYFLQNDLKSELSRYHTLINGHTSMRELESPCTVEGNLIQEHLWPGPVDSCSGSLAEPRGRRWGRNESRRERPPHRRNSLEQTPINRGGWGRVWAVH